MKHSYKIGIIGLLIALTAIPLAAHEDEHNDSTKQESAKTAISASKTETLTTEETGNADAVFRPYKEFPNLHPLVVHFPIVLLLIAFASQLTGLFIFREQFSWITLFLLAGGLVSAILASNTFHPHTSGLPANLQRLLETHELYASLTIWLATVAFVFKFISHFWLKRKRWAEIVVLLFLTGSAVTVSLAGHLGSQMVYIENIGPKGNYLEQHEE